ncbi:MAG TPA: radical SAM protein [Anaerolineales bacterium]|nr:radical SAM protein [Anaerolineales bacterium]
MMELNGLHILLTYTCNYECDHCFVWGSPRQTGVFTLARLDNALQQASDAGTIREIYFEGGEAFLYYPLLLEGVRRATSHGFSTGIVSNGYWATSAEDARIWLEPLVEAGLKSLEISSDPFHAEDPECLAAERVNAAAGELGLSTSTITIDHTGEARDAAQWKPGLPLSGGGVMFRGRAAEALVEGLPRQPWDAFPDCPYEELENPGRLHLDPFGNLHLCQGLVIGNLFHHSLRDILEEYDPRLDPLVGPLISGGPSLLIEMFLKDGQDEYVDACHACYAVRLALRGAFPAILGPDQMYGVN